MDRKTEYLVCELWILAWNASVQRAVLYKEGAWEKEKKGIDIFKYSIIKYIKTKIVPQCRVMVQQHQHCENIRSLINYANAIDTGILGANRYKYGVAQKLLNLALKYYWCLGQIEEPPHCPIDKIIIDIIIDKTSYAGEKNWTRILTEKEYIKIIDAIKSLANKEKCSIAQWELNHYKRPAQREDHSPNERLVELEDERRTDGHATLEYRGKPIKEYRLSASKILDWMRLPDFIEKSVSKLKELDRDYLYTEEFEPLFRNDYLGGGYQLGLIEKCKKAGVEEQDKRKKRYYPTKYAKTLSEEHDIERIRRIIAESVLHIVETRRETTPDERHAVLLLWLFLKIRASGKEPQEDDFMKTDKSRSFPRIRLRSAKGLCHLLLGGDTNEERQFFAKWESLLADCATGADMQGGNPPGDLD